MIEAARAAFDAYVAGYDAENDMIKLKIDHTYRVAALAERIARENGMDPDFACLLGLWHDIGRFEQVRRYGTFVDAFSVDHAELSADILFVDGLVRRFPVENMSDVRLYQAEIAIRAHNKLALPEGLDDGTRRWCDLLRDADKLDIFRVIAETSFETRAGTSIANYSEADKISPEVMNCVFGHRCVPHQVRKTRLDKLVSHCCMAFELVYPASRRIAAEQGHLSRLLKKSPRLDVVRRELEGALNVKL